MSKIGDLIKKATGSAGDIFTLVSHGHTLAEIARVFAKGEPTEEVLKAAGMGGLFGNAESRTLHTLLLQLEKELNGAESAILAFKAAAFKKPRNASWVIHLVWWANDNWWRDYIVGLPASAGKTTVEKTTTTTIHKNGSKTVKVSEKPITEPGFKTPLEFLRDLATKLLAEKDPKKLRALYKKIKAEHEGIGVPYPPSTRAGIIKSADAIVKWLTTDWKTRVAGGANTIAGVAKSGLRSAQAGTVSTIDDAYDHVTNKLANESAIVRFVRNWL